MRKSSKTCCSAEIIVYLWNLRKHTHDQIWLLKNHSKIIEEILPWLGWNHIWSLKWCLRRVILGWIVFSQKCIEDYLVRSLKDHSFWAPTYWSNFVFKSIIYCKKQSTNFLTKVDWSEIINWFSDEIKSTPQFSICSNPTIVAKEIYA